jgi:hypothetical protein
VLQPLARVAHAVMLKSPSITMATGITNIHNNSRHHIDCCMVGLKDVGGV